MNVDKRIQRSKNCLKEAMISLLMEKDYDSISVKEIIARADYSRPTFYKHYASKHDFIQKLVIEEVQELIQIRKDFARQHNNTLDSLTVQKLAEELFTHIYQNRALYKLFLSNKIFWNYPDIFTIELFKDSIQTQSVHDKEHFDEQYETFIRTSIMISTVKYWMMEDFKQSPSYIAQAYATAFLDHKATLIFH